MANPNEDSTADPVANHPIGVFDYIGAGFVPGHGLKVQVLVLVKDRDRCGPLQVNMSLQETEEAIRDLQSAAKHYKRLAKVTKRLEEVASLERDWNRA